MSPLFIGASKFSLKVTLCETLPDFVFLMKNEASSASIAFTEGVTPLFTSKSPNYISFISKRYACKVRKTEI